jgi:hypothetical protein
MQSRIRAHPRHPRHRFCNRPQRDDAKWRLSRVNRCLTNQESASKIP